MNFYELSALVCATLIFTTSHLFDPVRRLWPKFLGCPMCVGFWVGCCAPFLLNLLPSSVRSAFLAGTQVSIAAYALHLVFERLQP